MFDLLTHYCIFEEFCSFFFLKNFEKHLLLSYHIVLCGIDLSVCLSYHLLLSETPRTISLTNFS